jgi:hypothetical protein
VSGAALRQLVVFQNKAAPCLRAPSWAEHPPEGRPSVPSSSVVDGRTDEKVANRNAKDFGWEIAHVAVSRRPPIFLDTIVARTHMYTYAAKLWASSLVQGPISVAPCQSLYITIRNFFVAVCQSPCSLPCSLALTATPLVPLRRLLYPVVWREDPATLARAQRSKTNRVTPDGLAATGTPSAACQTVWSVDEGNAEVEYHLPQAAPTFSDPMHDPRAPPPLPPPPPSAPVRDHASRKACSSVAAHVYPEEALEVLK